MLRLALALVSGLITVLASAAALVDAPSTAKPTGRIVALDRIVAVVNDEVITRRDLDARIGVVIGQLKQEGTPVPARDALEKQVIERMIMNRLQLQYAKETGLRIDDRDLERAIARIAEDNKITLDQLRTTFEKEGVSFARFREDVRDEMTIGRLREREVDNKVQINESEVESFLTTQQADPAAVDEFNLSHVLVQVPEQASPERLQERRARAEQALAQIKAGTDFRQVAASFSDAPDAVQGGAMGWRELARLPAIFAEAAKSLQPGDVSGVLRSPNGFHVIKLNARRGQRALLVSQTRARHILIKTSELVSENDAKERLVKLKERIDNKADFGELARLQSEDSSAARGGDLGWLSPGDTVPEFEKAMDALKLNEVSAPVRSPFGWHLIQVLERRDQDMTQQQTRLRARQALRAQRADEAGQEWLRQLRDRSFVEYRLEEK